MGDSIRLLKHVRRLAAGDDLSDAGLLRRFAATADPEAFAELVRRHGPAVLGVCRRVLRNDADADDAFQAAFLVLARKAGAVRRRPAVGSWLYGVARHVAVRLRDKHARRHRHERAAAAARSVEVGEAVGDDLRAVLDAELGRLPDRERAAVLACLVRGLTQEQAAGELGWSLSTLRRRLDAGRERLRVRLARRLGEVPAGLLAGGAVVVSPTLAGVTTEAAIRFAAGVRVGAPALLAVGELAMMTRAKLVTLLGGVVAAAGLGVGGATVWPAARADDPKATAQKPTDLPKSPEPRSRPPGPAPKADAQGLGPAADEPIRAGDRLMIGVGDDQHPPAGMELKLYAVGPDGRVYLGRTTGGWFRAAGLAPKDAEAVLNKHLEEKFHFRGWTYFLRRYDREVDGPLADDSPARATAKRDDPPPADDRIKPGDRLRIETSELTGVALKGEYRVEPSGKVPVGSYGRVPVAGLTVEEAEAAVRQHLDKQFRGVLLLVTLADPPAAGGVPANAGDLAARIRRLEAEVAELKKTVAELRKK